MVAETAEVGDGFAFDGFENLGGGGVVAAAKAKVLPDEDAEFVGNVVKDVVFVDSSCPDTEFY